MVQKQGEEKKFTLRRGSNPVAPNQKCNFLCQVRIFLSSFIYQLMVIICYSCRFSFASLCWFHSLFHETNNVIVFFCLSFTQTKTEDDAFLRVFFSKMKGKSTRKKCRDDILQVKRSLYAKIRQFLSNFCFWTNIVTYALFPPGPSFILITWMFQQVVIV